MQCIVVLKLCAISPTPLANGSKQVIAECSATTSRQQLY